MEGLFFCKKLINYAFKRYFSYYCRSKMSVIVTTGSHNYFSQGTIMPLT